MSISKRMLLRIEQGKGRKDRFAMLSPAAIGAIARLVSYCPADGLVVSGP